MNAQWQPEQSHFDVSAAAAARFVQGAIVRLDAVTWLARNDMPLTESAADTAEGDGQGTILVAPVEDGGTWTMVISQSCELARSGRLDKQPKYFATVCPVDQVPARQRIKRPRSEAPHLIDITWHDEQPQPDHAWVADLSLTTTVERAVLVDRQPSGYPVNNERRQLSEKIARYFGRPALPDWFAPWIAPVAAIAEDKTGKQTELGTVLDQHLTELRVAATPDFDSPGPHRILITLVPNGLPDAYRSDDPVPLGLGEGPPTTQELEQAAKALRESLQRPVSEDPSVLDQRWLRFASLLLGRLQPHDQVLDVEVCIRGALTPDEFWESEALDLRYLSGEDPRGTVRTTSG